MKILIIDAQGGGLGRELIQNLKTKFQGIELIAVGTNSMATSNMIKAGAKFGATGENAVIVNSKTADLILGPVGILFANSMLGEITPKMAEAVNISSTKKILIPFFHDDNIIVGIEDYSMKNLIKLAMDEVEIFYKNA